jgi:uncharacterized protein YcaQ
MIEKISIQTARNLMIAAQGLRSLPDQPPDRQMVLETIRRMYLLQIDTINVIARSPYLVLWSRLGNYQMNWLEELLAEGAIFEYWAHAMCFIPVEDFPLYRRRMLNGAEEKIWPYKWALQWAEEHAHVLEKVRAHMRENGAVRSAEFENKNRAAGGWWNWKEEKDALETMLLTGEVMIARRHNFQRVYDLRERVLPDWDDAKTVSSEEYLRTLVLRSVKALGVAQAAWVADYFRLPKKDIPKRLEALAAEGQLLRTEIEGLNGRAYVHPDQLKLLDDISTEKLAPSLTTFLSPFDPLVWDRFRARDLFQFDYTIEVYTPAAKRRYGYFTLPILHKGQIIGRLDPKAHRAQKVFEIKSIHLEPGVKITDELMISLASALRRLADWHGTPELLIGYSDPSEVSVLLRAAL